MFPGTEEEGAPALPAGVRLTSVPRRILALLIDELLIAVPLFIGFAIAGHSPLDVAKDGTLAGWFNITSTVIALVYYTVAVWLRGRTLGKWAMRMKVVRVTDAGAVGLSAALLRALVPSVAGAIPTIGMYLVVVVYGIAVVDRRRQGLHDKAAGTVVIDTRR